MPTPFFVAGSISSGEQAGPVPVTLRAWGAGGGGGSPSSKGGGGGFTIATYEIVSGTTLNVIVGTKGGGSGRGGGPGLPGSPNGGTTGGGAAGGGGLVGVFAGPVIQANALVVAGSGGGASPHNPMQGGAGGGTNGQSGFGPGPSYGAGGTQNGPAPLALQGGNAGAGGAGGAGWHGGGGGQDKSATHSSGGGGSGFFRTGSLPADITYPGSGGSTSAGNNNNRAGPGVGPYGQSGIGQGGTSNTGDNAGPGLIVITDPAGTHVFTAGTHTHTVS